MAGTDISTAALRVSYDDVRDALERALATLGFTSPRAALCARLIGEASCDGVASHGLNLVPRFVTMVRAGVVDAAAEPVSVASAGAIERWDGRRRAGNLHAHACMRAFTRDPATTERTGRALPIGFWKGTGLAVMLDLVAAMLSGGRATHEIAGPPEKETAVSQVFIAFDAGWGAGHPDARLADRLVAHLKSASGDEEVRYPGERTRVLREKHLREGVPVDPSVWKFVQDLSS